MKITDYLGLIAVFVLLIACAPQAASPSPTATPAPTDVPPTDTPPPTPTDTPSPSATPLPPTSTATATPPPSPTPTETPFPDANFADCDVLTRQQAESILGPLTFDPHPLEWIGPDARRAGICIYDGTLNTATISMLWYDSEGDARAAYEMLSGGGGEAIAGIGDAALWNETWLSLYVWRDLITFSVEMTLPDGAREQAIQIGQIAVVRIP